MNKAVIAIILLSIALTSVYADDTFCKGALKDDCKGKCEWVNNKC